MNKTEYREGSSFTTLDAVNAAQWLTHESREPVRRMLMQVDGGTRTSMRVTLTPTFSIVTLLGSPHGDDTEDVVLTFRHWCSGYAGCMRGESAFVWVSGQWINLN